MSYGCQPRETKVPIINWPFPRENTEVWVMPSTSGRAVISHADRYGPYIKLAQRMRETHNLKADQCTGNTANTACPPLDNPPRTIDGVAANTTQGYHCCGGRTKDLFCCPKESHECVLGNCNKKKTLR